MKRAFWIFFAVPLLLSVCNFRVDCEAKGQITEERVQEAERFVQDLVGRIIKIINNTDVNVAEKELYYLLRECLATKNIARYLMGSQYKTLSADQKKAFCESLEVAFAHMYSSKFADYKTAEFEVGGVVTKGKQVRVEGRVKISGKEDIKLVCSVRWSKEKPQILDVIGDGVSITNMYREEISSRINKLGIAEFLADFTRRNNVMRFTKDKSNITQRN